MHRPILPMSNIFNIPNAENCFCHIHHYARGHRELEIWVLNRLDGTQTELHFSAVMYCLLSWAGADFTLGSASEILEIATQLQLLKNITDEMILELFSLYKVDLATPPVRILAATKDLNRDNYKQITLDDE